MKKYDSYKDSGIEWIDSIPKNWNAKPLFSIAEKNRAKNTNLQEETVLSLSYGNIIERDVESNFGLLPESFNTYQIVDEGYIILRLTDLQNDKKSLRVGLVRQKGVISSAYVGLILKNFNSTFIYYLLHSYDLQKVFYNFGSGVRQNMTFTDLRRLQIIEPTFEEQTQIANYLDHKTTQIDNLISKKERLIELLQEERTAIVNQAVTKGINPNVPMKDSGIEWLGEIPEHWEEARIKNVANIIGRIGFRGYTTEDLVEEGEGVISLSPSNIKNQNLVLEKCTYLSWEKYHESPEIKIYPNDILLVKTGSTIGKTAIVFEGTPEMTLNPQLVVLKDVQLQSKFLYFLMISNYFQGYFDVYTAGGSTPAISQEKINNFKIAFPEETEQKTIVDNLERMEIRITDLIEKYRTEIELLKEYKIALISEVVTGKVDVRDEQ